MIGGIMKKLLMNLRNI